VKITFISDTHTKHRELTKDLPGGNVLIHSGDILNSGRIMSELEDFCDWLIEDVKKIYEDIVIIAGNHDFLFENSKKDEAEKLVRDTGAFYLNDSGCEINGVKFWGSPIQPAFFNWAFNRARNEETANDPLDYHDHGCDLIKPHWDMIPEDTDVLITHGPPYGVLDECKDGRKVGCEILMEKVLEVKPKIHVFGHIHEQYGSVLGEDTTFINASSLNRRYKYSNKPISLCLKMEK